MAGPGVTPLDPLVRPDRRLEALGTGDQVGARPGRAVLRLPGGGRAVVLEHAHLRVVREGDEQLEEVHVVCLQGGVHHRHLACLFYRVYRPTHAPTISITAPVRTRASR